MRVLLLLAFLLFLPACQSGKSKQVDKAYATPKFKLKVKFEDSPLSAPGEWLGGSEINPRYYTVEGSEIITPIFGVDVVPITKRSLNHNGKVIYPHAGYQVIGDLRLEHFLSLIKKVKSIDFDRSNYRPPVIVADSNFLNKGAVLKSHDGKVLGNYEFKALNWYKK